MNVENNYKLYQSSNFYFRIIVTDTVTDHWYHLIIIFCFNTAYLYILT